MLEQNVWLSLRCQWIIFNPLLRHWFNAVRTGCTTNHVLLVMDYLNYASRNDMFVMSKLWKLMQTGCTYCADVIILATYLFAFVTGSSCFYITFVQASADTIQLSVDVINNQFMGTISSVIHLDCNLPYFSNDLEVSTESVRPCPAECAERLNNQTKKPIHKANNTNNTSNNNLIMIIIVRNTTIQETTWTRQQHEQQMEDCQSNHCPKKNWN